MPAKRRNTRKPALQRRSRAAESAPHVRDTVEPPVFRPCENYRWRGIEIEPYKIATNLARDFAGASRQVIAGKNGEATKFHLRYFELEPGGFTSFEHHRHSHVVIGVRGRGRVRVGDSSYQLRRFDVLYIGPHQPHRLEAGARGRFGFFCIVDASRDRPRPIRE